MHRRQTQNLTPPPLPQLLPHNPIQPTPNRIPTLIHQHASIIVKPYHTAIGSLVLVFRANDDGVPDVAATDLVGRADGDGTPASGFRTEVALFLDDYYYTVA